MDSKKDCAALIQENYDRRNKQIEEMIAYNNGDGEYIAKEKLSEWRDAYYETNNEEPSEQQSEKFLEDLIDSNEYNETSIYELALGHSKYSVIKIELSTGGPADFIEAYLDDEGIVQHASYHYQDWFDGAKMEISENSPMWNFIETYLVSCT